MRKQRFSWLRRRTQWLRFIVLISKSASVVYFVMWFKNGADRELGHFKCGAQKPGPRDMDECVWLGVDTEYHHHVLSDGGL